MGFFDSVKKALATTLDYISAPVSQPLTTFTQGLSAGAKAVATSRANIQAGNESGIAKIATIVGTTAVIGGAFLAAAPAATSGAVGAVARSAIVSVIPKTLAGKAAVVTAAPIVYGLVKANPQGAQTVVEKAPSQLANFGQNVGSLVSDPSLNNVKEIYKENPVIATTATAAVVGAIGLATAGIVSNISNTLAIKKNTAATQDAIQAISDPATQQITANPSNPQTIQIINQLPATLPESVPTAEAPTKAKATTKKTTTAKKKAPAKKKAAHKYKSRKKVNGKWVYKY